MKFKSLSRKNKQKELDVQKKKRNAKIRGVSEMFEIMRKDELMGSVSLEMELLDDSVPSFIRDANSRNYEKAKRKFQNFKTAPPKVRKGNFYLTKKGNVVETPAPLKSKEIKKRSLRQVRPNEGFALMKEQRKKNRAQALKRMNAKVPVQVLPQTTRGIEWSGSLVEAEMFGNSRQRRNARRAKAFFINKNNPYLQKKLDKETTALLRDPQVSTLMSDLVSSTQDLLRTPLAEGWWGEFSDSMAEYWGKASETVFAPFKDGVKKIALALFGNNLMAVITPIIDSLLHIVVYITACVEFSEGRCSGFLFGMITAHLVTSTIDVGTRLVRVANGPDEESFFSTVASMFINLFTFKPAKSAEDGAKVISSVINAFGNLGKALEKIGDFIWQCFTRLYESFYGVPYIDPREREDYKELLSLVGHMATHVRKLSGKPEIMVRSKVLRSQIIQLKVDYLKMRETVFTDPDRQKAQLHSWCEKVYGEWTREVLNVCVSINNYSRRPKPKALFLLGPPGVGKSYLKDVFLAMRNEGEVTWTKNFRESFDSGYNGQKVILIDDFLQFNDSESRKDHTSFVSDILSDNPMISTQATLELKGSIMFDPEVVICLSNSKDLLNTSISDPGAIARRFDWKLEVVPLADEADMVEGRVKWRKSHEENSKRPAKDLYVFYALKLDETTRTWVREEVNGKPVEVDVFEIANELAKPPPDTPLVNLKKVFLESSKKERKPLTNYTGTISPADPGKGKKKSYQLKGQGFDEKDDNILDAAVSKLKSLFEKDESVDPAEFRGVDVDDPALPYLLYEDGDLLFSLEAGSDAKRIAEVASKVKELGPREAVRFYMNVAAAKGTLLSEKIGEGYQQLAEAFGLVPEWISSLWKSIEVLIASNKKWILPAVLGCVCVVATGIGVGYAIFRQKPENAEGYDKQPPPKKTAAPPVKAEGNAPVKAAKAQMLKHVFLLKVDGQRINYGVLVNNKLFVTTAHAISSGISDSGIELYHPTTRHSWCFRPSEVSFYKQTDTDLAFFVIDSPRSTALSQTAKTTFGEPVGDFIYTPRFEGDKVEWLATDVSSYKSPNFEQGSYVYKGRDIVNCAMGYITGVYSDPGDCGLPYFTIDGVSPRVLGIHCAGAPHYCCLTEIQTHHLVEYFPQAHGNVQTNVPRIDVSELTARGFQVVGNVPNNMASVIQCQTKLQPSPLDSFFAVRGIKTTALPAHLKPFRRNGEYISPLWKAIEKIHPEKRIISADHEQYMDFVLKTIKVDPKTDFTFMPERCMPHKFDLSASAGWPYNKEKMFKVADCFVSETELHPVARDRIKAWFKKPDNDLFMTSASLKDERRPLAKVNEGKTRLYYAGSFTSLYIGKWCMGPLFDAMTKQHNDISNPCKVGINPHSTDWTILEQNHTKHKYHIIGDVSGQDVSTSHNFSEMLGRCTSRVYERSGLVNYAPYVKDRLVEYVKAFTEGKVLLGTQVLYLYLMFSGIYGTSHANSINLSTCIVRAIAIVKKWTSVPDDFWTHFTISVFGDDFIVSCSEDLDWNLIFKIVREDSHFLITNENKEEANFVPRPWSEVTFLKRGFRRENNVVYAPLAENVLFEMLRYVKVGKGLTLRQSTALNIDAAVRELMHHDKDDALRIYKIIKECADLASLPCPALNYNASKADIVEREIPIEARLEDMDDNVVPAIIQRGGEPTKYEKEFKRHGSFELFCNKKFRRTDFKCHCKENWCNLCKAKRYEYHHSEEFAEFFVRTCKRHLGPKVRDLGYDDADIEICCDLIEADFDAVPSLWHLYWIAGQYYDVHKTEFQVDLTIRHYPKVTDPIDPIDDYIVRTGDATPKSWMKMQLKTVWKCMYAMAPTVTERDCFVLICRCFAMPVPLLLYIRAQWALLDKG